MLFNTKTFPVFLLLVLVSYYLLPRKYRSIQLLFFSYLFYSFWNWKFLVLLVASTVVDYYCGLALSQAATQKRKKQWLYLSLVSNLGTLAFFKYFNFFSDSTIQFCQLFGFEASFSTLNIVLPVGISFYVFQSLSYVIDVYRGNIKPVTNLRDFALYVSFFPQLVAGPIERATTLMPQLQALRNPTRLMIWEGLLLCASGYIKKVVLSDQISPQVDAAFANWATLSTIYLWEGILLFSLQIYFDFSGYTDIARGVSKWFGVELMLNFRQPYLSKSVTEFWSRWHISLSTWLKEYLYFPLGGNRKGSLRTYLNLMVTMLLGGLWHGANMTFVFWGFLHGLFLCVHKLWLKNRPAGREMGWVTTMGSILLTYFLVVMTWIPFRSATISDAFGYMKKLFVFEGPFDPSVPLYLAMLYFVWWIIDFPVYRSNNEYLMMRFPRAARISYVMITSLIVGILILTVKEARPFIYFQF